MVAIFSTCEDGGQESPKRSAVYDEDASEVGERVLLNIRFRGSGKSTLYCNETAI